MKTTQKRVILAEGPAYFFSLDTSSQCKMVIYAQMKSFFLYLKFFYRHLVKNVGKNILNGTAKLTHAGPIQ